MRREDRAASGTEATVPLAAQEKAMLIECR
jgi:hypothetical protein